MTRRKETERELRAEVRRLKAALGAIHHHLHENEIDRAHECCECAIDGKTVSQPNISAADTAGTMTFAAAFNAITEAHRVRACAVVLVPIACRPGAVSLQIMGEVMACKIVEEKIRGRASTYMGDHAAAAIGAR